MGNNADLQSGSLSKNSQEEFYGYMWFEGLGGYRFTEKCECPFCAIFPDDFCDSCEK